MLHLAAVGLRNEAVCSLSRLVAEVERAARAMYAVRPACFLDAAVENRGAAVLASVFTGR